MAQFIHLTLGNRVGIRINVDRILAYHPEHDEEPGLPAMPTLLMMSDGAAIQVQEHASQIDRMIDPTHTP